MMQLEVGKYYKTRAGRKVGPCKDKSSGTKIYDYEVDGFCYFEDGTFGYGSNCRSEESDIIAEWPDEPAQLTAIDHLRKAAELFLAEGKDAAAFNVLGVILDHE